MKLYREYDSDETFDKILDGIGFTVPDILRDIPVFKYVVSLYSFI